jgi:hypothetical protein
VDVLKRTDLDPVKLAGRTLQKAVGGPCEGTVTITRMTVGFARYSERSDGTAPSRRGDDLHRRRPEWLHPPGTAPDQRGDRVQPEAGMILHFAELEWHVFEWDEDGHIDALFIYGQVDNIRPDQIGR